MESKTVPTVTVTLDQLKKATQPTKKQKKAAKKQRKRIAKQVRAQLTTGQELVRNDVLRQVQTKVLPRNRAGFRAEVIAVMKSIATPGDCVPVRVSTVYSSDETAIAAPFAKFPETPSNVSYADRLMPVGEQVTYVRREPSVAIVRYIPWDGTSTALYGAVETDPDTLQPDNQIQFSNDGFERNIRFSYLSYSNGKQYFGPKMLVGTTKSRPGVSFWWVRTSDSVEMVVSNLDEANGPRNYVVMVYAWDSKRGDFQIGSIGFAAVPAGDSSVGSFTVPQVNGFNWHGYIGLAVKATSAGAETSSSIAFTVNWKHDVFAHLPLPDLFDNISAAPAIRIIGASCMYTNTASPLNRQGEITGYQSPEGTHWMDYVANYTALKSRKNSRTMDIVKGMYGFLKLTDNDDLKYKSNYDASETGNNVVESSYPLDDEHPFLVLYHKTSSGDTESGYTSTDFCIEYQSGDTWRVLAPPECSVDAYTEATEALRDVEQFHENPLHLSEIWAKVRNLATQAANGLAKYGPKVIDAVNTYGPSVVRGAATLASVL